MAQYEQKPGDIIIFKNDKDGNEKRPDYTGNGLDLDGKKIFVSLWLKDGQKGKFMAGSIQYPREAADSAKDQRQDAPPADDFDLDDDIPF
jgi:hypothetical protein